MADLLILGVGGHARVVIEAALCSGENILGLLDVDYKGQQEAILGVDVLGGVELLDCYDRKQIFVIVAIGDNVKREALFLILKEKGFKLATIIHPTAIVSSFVNIGKGVFINSGAIVNAGVVIGDNTIINTRVIVEHEVKIGEHSHLAPGVSIGGRTTIGKNSFIGIGSSIADYIKIGQDVVIGAGSVIVKDINDMSKVVGVGRVLF
jgi:UDP-perosamine 4-acetyltransferase